MLPSLPPQKVAPKAALKEALGRDASFREGQLEAIESLLKPGARMLLVQSTGWGKSLVYFLAARLLLPKKTLVISPLIALMRNQVAFARRFRVRAEALHSENREDWPKIEDDLPDVLLVSPERLHHKDFRENVLPRFLAETGLLVIDEAHCISEWGHDFRPEYRTILRELKTLPREASILGTTATSTERVAQDLRSIFGPFLEIQRGRLVRPSLRLVAVPLLDNAERLAWLVKYLPRLPGSGIVYALTVFDSIEVARWLQMNGIEAEPYHSELGGERRIELEEAFSANKLKALVATTALGMGYDKADVGFVVHYQLPASLIAYYQQIGRAGRAMDRAFAVLLAGGEDEDIVQSLIRSARPPDAVFESILRATAKGPLSFSELNHVVKAAPTVLRQTLDILDAADALSISDRGYAARPPQTKREIAHGEEIRRLRGNEFREILAYIESPKCRMQAVAEALGDPSPEPCGICDRCNRIAEPNLDPALIVEARRFLQGEPKVLLPRVQLPVDIEGRTRRISKDEQVLPGIVLGVFGDSGWGKQVREGKYSEGRFAETLVEAAVRALRERDFQPNWLTWVPSTRPVSPVADFAARLAKALGIPGVPAVKRVRPKPPQKTMEAGAEQFLNVWDAFLVDQVPKASCLLVDDIVDSGWTLTVVGLSLRQAGCEAVMPLALAAASVSRIKLLENPNS